MSFFIHKPAHRYYWFDQSRLVLPCYPRMMLMRTMTIIIWWWCETVCDNRKFIFREYFDTSSWSSFIGSNQGRTWYTYLSCGPGKGADVWTHFKAGKNLCPLLDLGTRFWKGQKRKYWFWVKKEGCRKNCMLDIERFTWTDSSPTFLFYVFIYLLFHLLIFWRCYSSLKYWPKELPSIFPLHSLSTDICQYWTEWESGVPEFTCGTDRWSAGTTDAVLHSSQKFNNHPSKAWPGPEIQNHVQEQGG